MTRLVIYGDFNCPFSALASARADVLLAADAHEIDWRAVQHDTTIPASGEPVEGDAADELAAEVATIGGLSEHDVRLRFVVPSVRANTAAASATFAAAVNNADRLRRRLFAAVWAEGRNISDATELDRLDAGGRDVAIASGWQCEFEALPRPITPTVVLPDGHISRGLGALARPRRSHHRAVIPTANEGQANETYELSDMAYHYVAHEPQMGRDIMELRGGRHRTSAKGSIRQHLNDDGDFFDAVWQVVNWNDVAPPLTAAPRLNA